MKAKNVRLGVLLLALFTIFVLAVTACAAPAAQPATSGETAAEGQEAASEPVEVVYLSAGTADVEQDWNEKWVAEFNETHDDIQIQYELVSWSDLLPKAASMIAAGTPPDIAWYAPSQIKEWYYGGLLEPLDEWLPQDIEELLPPIKDPASSDVIYDGKYYGMPFCLAGRAMAVRQDILAEAGYDVEELWDWDWDTYREIAEAVTEPPDQFATQIAFGEPRITASYAGLPYFLGNGLRDLTDFEDKEAYIESLQSIKDIFPYTPPAQVQWRHADTLTAYMNGVTVMHPTGSYFFGDIKRNAPEIMSEEKTAVLPFPKGPSAEDNVVPWYTVGWVMFEASENKEAAAEVLHFLAAKEAVNEWPMNMAPKAGLQVDDRVMASEFGEEVRWWLDDWHHLMDTTDPVQRPGYAPATEIDKIFNNELLRLYNDEITPEEAYENLKAQIEPIVVAPGE